MEKNRKIQITLIIIFLISLFFSSYSQATIGDIFSDSDEFLGYGDPITATINVTQLEGTSDFLYKLLLAIGIIVMFIVGTILGIQFIVASAEDKAKVKEALIPYIVGCTVIFGAFIIWKTTVNLGQEILYDDGGYYEMSPMKNRGIIIDFGTLKKDSPFYGEKVTLMVKNTSLDVLDYYYNIMDKIPEDHYYRQRIYHIYRMA